MLVGEPLPFYHLSIGTYLLGVIRLSEGRCEEMHHLAVVEAAAGASVRQVVLVGAKVLVQAVVALGVTDDQARLTDVPG